jgi:transposase
VHPGKDSEKMEFANNQNSDPIKKDRKAGMQIKTILNRILKFKSFVYTTVCWNNKEVEPTLEVGIEARVNGRPVCSGCECVGPGYDHLPTRRFEFIPIWGIKVFLLYAPRRVDCWLCGVRVEQMPWASGKHQQTNVYMQFLAHWARKLSWTDVARSFNTSWVQVCHAVEYVVSWGLEHRTLGAISAIGVDEIHFGQGQKYLTLVYEIGAGCIRLLWIGEERTVASFEKFFDMIGKDCAEGISFVCSDMWRPYLRVIRERCVNALNILDRFHIVAKINVALDEVRASEARRLARDGFQPVLKKSRWCLLKHKKNTTKKQRSRLSDLLRYNLKTVRAYLLKEDFQQFWDYNSTTWAGKFLDRWCTDVMRSRIDPMKKIARMLRKHRELILNYFRAKKEFSSGVIEGLNNKAKVTIRKSYGFRTFRIAELALYHGLGKLPEPKMTHQFY